jgi:hypothetical protein
MVIGYTRHVNEHGGVVSWDVPTGRDGLIPDAFMEQLTALKNAYL